MRQRAVMRCAVPATERMTPAAAPRTATLTVSELAAGGDGVGRVDGLAVFVPRTAVGDIVEIEVQPHGRFARGRVRRVVTPSVDRVTPPCPHFDEGCGGCDWQHVAIGAQRAAKRAIVQNAFQRIARRAIALPEIVGDEATLGYRRAMRVTARRGAGFGFHAHNAPDRVVPVQQCLLARPALTEVWRVVRALVERERALLPAAAGDARAPLQIALRELEDGDVAVVIHHGTRWHHTAAQRLGESHGRIAAVLWQRTGASPRVMWSRTSSEAEMRRLQRAASFVQVNASMAPALHALASQALLAHAPRHVIDAYAGAGAHSDEAYARGVQVTAIELDPAACAELRRRRTNGTAANGASAHGATVHEGAVEAVLPSLLRQAEGADVPIGAVLLNPPRGGVDVAVTSALNEAHASLPSLRRLVYVSCDPATLARDVARLDAWRVVHVQCVDMFPQTAHVETVCVLERTAPTAA